MLTVMTFLDQYNIPLMNCRGQSYDNEANMSGRYSGLQAKIKEQNKYALFIQCAGHSLNLVGDHAVNSTLNVIMYFDFVQNLYNFFSSLPYRWEIMVLHLGSCLKVVKQLSRTRWLAHADAVSALCEGYEEIRSSLDYLGEENHESSETWITAQSLRDKLDTLETTFLTIFWNDILKRFNSVSKVLQRENMNLSTATKLLKSLKAFVTEKRNCFEDCESQAKEKSRVKNYQDSYKRTKQRSSTLTFVDRRLPRCATERQ